MNGFYTEEMNPNLCTRDKVITMRLMAQITLLFYKENDLLLDE